MQWLTLVFETAGILGVFSRRLRPWIGLMLVSFYFGVVLTFDYGFHMNLALTALYFLPFDRWFPAWSRRRRERWGVVTWRLTDAWADRIVAGLVARFDTAERIQIVLVGPPAKKALVEQGE
jgi:hypothetical protein